MREAAVETLRRQYSERASHAKASQVQRYVEAANQAVAENNFVSAANALRIAVSLTPEDGALVKRLEDFDQRSATELADKYLEQAKYEESNGKLLEAARSYERAAKGKPTGETYERAASCYLAPKGDLKKAVELGKKAVLLSPNDGKIRFTLARIYAQAGMKQSATAEIERASALSPGDDTIKDWLKRIKRGDF